MALKRIRCIKRPEPNQKFLLNLVRSQISFGLAYLAHARIAYGEGRVESGENAREIVLNSYRAATRFAAQLAAAQLAKDTDSSVRSRLEALRYGIEVLWPDAMHSREIA
ncbi:MAG: hypothetical protein JO319_11410 [Acidobacteriaceae bacterium]|nr:hypothetical protein [Acidobacteriaceae bacterium]